MEEEGEAPFGQQIEQIFEEEDEPQYEDEEEEEGEGKKVDVKGILDSNTKKNLPRIHYKQKIIIMPGNSEGLSSKDVKIIKLSHPRRKIEVPYIIQDNQICEINRAIERPSSWFVDDTVDDDGSLYIATPIDPLFILLQLLEKHRKQTSEHPGVFCSLEEMLDDSDLPGFAHLKDVITGIDLSLVADINEDMGEEKFYRLNDQKVVLWLQCKVEQIVQEMEKSDLLHTSGGAAAAIFRSSSKKKMSKDEMLKNALGFLSEYVANETLAKVAESLGIKNFGPIKLSALDNLVMHPNDKPITPEKRAAPDTPEKEGTPKRQKLSIAQARLAKTNTKGMSKISSFFVPINKSS